MNQRGSAYTTEHTQLYPADETETQLRGIVNVGEAMKKREQVEKRVTSCFFKQGEKRSGQQEKPYSFHTLHKYLCGKCVVDKSRLQLGLA